jgi:hypothetical protein
MGGMGRYSPRLTQDQRDAIVRAMLDGWSAAEVVKAAADGELEDLEPFEVSETACGDLRREAERNPLWVQRVRRNGGPAVKQDEARGVAEASHAAAEERDRQEPEDDQAAGKPDDQDEQLDVFAKRDRQEAEERAYLERQIARVLAIDEPNAKDLHTLKTARDRIETLNQRAARKAPPASSPEAEEPELSPLEQELLRKAVEYEEARAAGKGCECDVPLLDTRGPVEHERSGWTAEQRRAAWDGDGHPLCQSCRLPVCVSVLRTTWPRGRAGASRAS